MVHLLFTFTIVRLESLIKFPGNKEHYDKALEMAAINQENKMIYVEDKNDSNDYTQPLVSLQRKVFISIRI
jgi:hypothetical protein